MAAGKFVLTRRWRVIPQNPSQTKPVGMTNRKVTLGTLEYDGKTWYTLEGYDDTNLTYNGTVISIKKYSLTTDSGKSFYDEIHKNNKDYGYSIYGVASCICAGTFTLKIGASPLFTKKKDTVKGFYDCYCDHGPCTDYKTCILMPRVDDARVSGRGGVLLHCGTSFQDTLGCILLGKGKDEANGKLTDTELAFQEVYDILKQKVNGKYPTFQLEIKRAYQN